MPESPINDLDRATELRLKGHLYEIGKINDEVIGGRQGFVHSIGGYRRTLTNVAACSDVESLDKVAKRIKQDLRDDGERPANRAVRRYARRVVSENGYPATSYLNRA